MRASVAGALTVAFLSAAIVLGSRGLRDFDLALLPYAVGVLCASFAVGYRCSEWLERPATRVYWSRGWELLFRRPGAAVNLLLVMRSAGSNLAAQSFIRRRGSARWIAHLLMAWGCLIAVAVTFPLVFGWLHFETRAVDPHWYRVMVLGLTIGELQTESLAAQALFNILNVSAVMVILGAAFALRRRLAEPGSLAGQQFGSDIVPLLLLIGVSATGLMLTFSTHLLHGRGHSTISLIHALVVTGTLLYLPFGKFFHVFQRPAQLGVSLYRRANEDAPKAPCRVCGEGFAASMHVADLKSVLTDVGLDWGLHGRAAHYAEVCPRCRRRLLGFSQGRLMGR